ncbi:MAG: helicase C-terminal domain-containing protein [Terracidiphilus sp.]
MYRAGAISPLSPKPLPAPAAVLTLKHCPGRLIRSLKVRGVLVLLEPRIRSQRFGRRFLKSQPPYRMTTGIVEVGRFFREVNLVNEAHIQAQRLRKE